MAQFKSFTVNGKTTYFDNKVDTAVPQEQTLTNNISPTFKSFTVNGQTIYFNQPNSPLSGQTLRTTNPEQTKQRTDDLNSQLRQIEIDRTNAEMIGDTALAQQLGQQASKLQQEVDKIKNPGAASRINYEQVQAANSEKQKEAERNYYYQQGEKQGYTKEQVDSALKWKEMQTPDSRLDDEVKQAIEAAKKIELTNPEGRVLDNSKPIAAKISELDRQIKETAVLLEKAARTNNQSALQQYKAQLGQLQAQKEKAQTQYDLDPMNTLKRNAGQNQKQIEDLQNKLREYLSIYRETGETKLADQVQYWLDYLSGNRIAQEQIVQGKKDEDRNAKLEGMQSGFEQVKSSADFAKVSSEGAAKPTDMQQYLKYGIDAVANKAQFVKDNWDIVRAVEIYESQRGVRPASIEQAQYLVDNLDKDILEEQQRSISFGELAYLTPEELQVYNYYIGKGDEKSAEQYIETLQRKLNARAREKEVEYFTDYAGRNKAGATIQIILGQYGQIGSTLAGAGQAVKNLVTGKDEQLDPNSAAMTPVAREQVFRQEILKDLSSAQQFWASTGLSIAQNLARLPLGKLGLVVAGSSAAANTMYDTAQRGGNTNQAVLSGLISGLVEYATEKIPLERLMDAAGGGAQVSKNAIRNILQNAGIQAATEGGEEIVSEIANKLTDMAVMGDRSEYNQYIQSLMAQGLSYSQAQNQANHKFWGDVFQAGLGGAVSGGLMGAGSAAIGEVGNYSKEQHSKALKQRITMEEFTDNNSEIWNNVDYNDKETQKAITKDVAGQMVNEGNIVEITDEDLQQYSEYFPDLRHQKKSERTPILKEKIGQLKSLLKEKLTSTFSGKNIELDVKGRILDAKLYDTGIREVMDKLVQNKAAMIGKSEEIFAKARYLYSTQDKTGSDKYYRWNYFYVPLSINGDMAGVRIAVRDMVERNESQIYNWSIKKEAAVPTELVPSKDGSRVISHKLPFNPTVAQTASGVNSKYMPTNNVVIPTIEDIVRKTGEGMNLTEEQVTALQRDPNVRNNYNRMVENMKQIAEGRGSGYNDGRIDLNEMGGQINGREEVSGTTRRNVEEGGKILWNDGSENSINTGTGRSQEDVLQRLGREIEEDKRKPQKVVENTEYYYTPVAKEQYSPVASEAQRILVESGIDAVVTDGALIARKNGRLNQNKGEASTLPDGTVIIRNDAALPPVEMANHEKYHVIYQLEPEIAQGYYDAVTDGNLDFSSPQLIEFANQIIDYYYGSKFDLTTDYNKLYQELCAFISGDLANNYDHATEYFGNMFYDWNRVVNSWQQMNTDFKNRKTIGQTGNGSNSGGKVANGYGPNTVGAAEHNSRSYAGMQSEFGVMKPGEQPRAREVDVPKRTSADNKVMQGVRTIMEANATPDSMIDTFENAIVNDAFSYEVLSNKKAINHADRIIANEGLDVAMRQWQAAIDGKGVPDKYEMALGERLFVEAANAGDVKTALTLSAEIAEAATRAGQTAQAMSMLKRMSPQGQLIYIERCVQKIQKELNKKYAKHPEKLAKLTIDEQLTGELLKAQTKEEMANVSEKIFAKVAEQLPANWVDKWNAWRYMSMLANPTTHIRNVAGNAMFVPLRKAKNLTGTALEQIFIKDQSQRTKAVLNPLNSKDKALLDFAEQNFKENERYLASTGKYNPSDAIRDNRRIFNTGWLEKTRKGNTNFLEAEDIWFLRNAYKDSFAQAMKARGNTVEFLNSGTQQAKNALMSLERYAADEAWKATYRDASKTAEALNRFKNTNAFTKIVGEGILPFTKTPVNIAKRGIEYSPIGIIKTLTKGAYDLKQGNINTAQFIDQISAGLTGTGIAILGAFLAHNGLLAGAGKEDKKERQFDQLQGGHQYALTIGDHSYTLDWAAPAVMPLFVGCEIYNNVKDGKWFDFKTLVDQMTKINEPLFEMSLLQGVNSAISAAANGDGNEITNILLNSAVDYFGQAVPTVLGKLARTIDPVKRSPYVSKDDTLPEFMSKAVQRTAAKIPGVSMMLQPQIDQWGREITYGGLGERLIENFVSPGYYSKKNSTDADKEVKKLYEETGEKSVLPGTAPKYFTVNNNQIDLNAKRYTKYAIARGQTAFNLVGEISNDTMYRQLSNSDKVEVFKKIYDYANAVGKSEVSIYSLDSWMKKANEVERRADVSVAKYILWKVSCEKNSQKEMAAKLNRMNFTEEQKLAIMKENWPEAKEETLKEKLRDNW